jgi:hypothetical protein
MSGAGAVVISKTGPLATTAAEGAVALGSAIFSAARGLLSPKPGPAPGPASGPPGPPAPAVDELHGPASRPTLLGLPSRTALTLASAPTLATAPTLGQYRPLQHLTAQAQATLNAQGRLYQGRLQSVAGIVPGARRVLEGSRVQSFSTRVMQSDRMPNHGRAVQNSLPPLVGRTSETQRFLRQIRIVENTRKQIEDYYKQFAIENGLTEATVMPILIPLGKRFIIATAGEKGDITEFWTSGGRKRMSIDGTLHTVTGAQLEHPIPKNVWTLNLMSHSDLVRINEGYNYHYALTRIQGVCQDTEINMIRMEASINTGPQARIMNDAIRRNVSLDHAWGNATLEDRNALIAYHTSNPINGVAPGLERMRHDISSRIPLLIERRDRELAMCSPAQINDRDLMEQVFNGVINSCNVLVGNIHRGGALPVKTIESLLYRLLSTINLPVTEGLVTTEELQNNLISLSTKTLLYTTEINEKIQRLNIENANGGFRKNRTLNRKKMVRKTRKLGGGPLNRAGMMIGKQLMTKAAQGALKSQPLAQTAFKMAPMALGTQLGNPALRKFSTNSRPFNKAKGAIAEPKESSWTYENFSNSEKFPNFEEFVKKRTNAEKWNDMQNIPFDTMQSHETANFARQQMNKIFPAGRPKSINPDKKAKIASESHKDLYGGTRKRRRHSNKYRTRKH